MSEMVERIAKEIQARGSVRYGVAWDNVPLDAKEMFRHDARAAIAIVLEIWETTCDEALTANDVIDDWQEKLEVALRGHVPHGSL